MEDDQRLRVECEIREQCKDFIAELEDVRRVLDPERDQFFNNWTLAAEDLIMIKLKNVSSADEAQLTEIAIRISELRTCVRQWRTARHNE